MFKKWLNKVFGSNERTVYLVIALGKELDCEEIIVGTYSFEEASQFAEVYSSVHSRAVYVKAIDVV